MLGGTAGADDGTAVEVDELNGLLTLLQPASIGRPAKRTHANATERHNWAIGMVSPTKFLITLRGLGGKRKGAANSRGTT